MTKIVGFREVDFTDNNGKQVKGTKVYVTDDSNQYVTGVSTDAVFVPDGKISFRPSLGASVDIRYNKYGKIDRIDLVSDGLKGGKF